LGFCLTVKSATIKKDYQYIVHRQRYGPFPFASAEEPVPASTVPLAGQLNLHFR